MKNIIFLLSLIISINIFAATYWNEQVIDISTPKLKNVLVEANTAFKNKYYKNSIDLLDTALEMKSAPEFLPENNDPVFGPLRLQLISQKAMILSVILNDNPKIESICLNTLNEYKESAKGKKWLAYKNLFHRLIQYHFIKKDNKKCNKMFDELIKYDNDDISTLILGLTYNLSSSKAINFINNYIKRKGNYNPDITFFKIIYKKKTGKNVFQEALNFLKTYPNANIKRIKEITNIARETISFDKPEQAKEYYNTLTILAIKQPNDKSGLEVIGFLINERKKIETIMPEIQNP